MESTTTPPMSERKAEIVRIAGGLFAQRGFEGTSLRDIGQAVGMRRGSLYSHFESKEEIIGVLLQPAIEELLRVLREARDGEGSGQERLRQGLVEAVACCIAHRDAFLILFQDRHLIDESEVLKDVSEQVLAVAPLWLSMITAGQADGSIRADLAPASIALCIFALLMGALSNRHVGLRVATGREPGGAPEMTHLLTTLLFEGIAVG